MAKNYEIIGGRKITRARLGLGILGNAAGIAYAVSRKSGFWGYVGWFILGGMIGSGVGYIVSKPKDDKKKGSKERK